ncbi:uncharacterized protein V6R79_019641 [Siganus canaliculatus]
MSVPGRSVSFLLLLLFLLLGLLSVSEAKRQSGSAKPREPPPSAPPAKKPRSRSVSSSGELSTKEGHRCTWQTSGDGLVTLLVNCSAETLGEPQRYWCRYAGKPELCQAYGVKSSQYWKQLVGKLKKRQNACDGEKVLKAKTCKKAPAEAHMKLAQRGGAGAEEEEVEAERKAGGKKRGKEEKRRKKEEEEEKRSAEEEEEGLLNDMEPVQSYCSEGWHSVCAFFLKFFEG